MIVIVFRFVIGIVIGIVVCLYGLSFSGSSYYVGKWWGHGGVDPLAPPPTPVRWPWVGGVAPIPLSPFRDSVRTAFPSFVYREVLSI